MVNDKVNDMFEQQQNTGKLEERNKALDKRERVVFSKEERENIYDKLTNYIDIPDMPLDNNDTYPNFSFIPTFFLKNANSLVA